jgi:DNA-binding ferritin-like protein (Dps family)
MLEKLNNQEVIEQLKELKKLRNQMDIMDEIMQEREVKIGKKIYKLKDLTLKQTMLIQTLIKLNLDSIEEWERATKITADILGEDVETVANNCTQSQFMKFLGVCFDILYGDVRKIDLTFFQGKVKEGEVKKTN